MIIDKENGSLHFGDYVLAASMTQSEFLETMTDLVAISRPEGSRIVYRLKPLTVEMFIIDAFVHFSGERLDYVQFDCSTPEIYRESWVSTCEYLRKLLNDSVIRANLGEPHETISQAPFIPEGERMYQLSYNFDWGSACSTYDDRGGAIFIGIRYRDSELRTDAEMLDDRSGRNHA